MRWDWHSATYPTTADEALAVISRGVDLASVEPSRGLHSYAYGAEVKRGPRTLCRAFWGGVNGDDVHVQASGEGTPAIVALMRSRWPEHRVSRADACQDWSHSKAWRWVSKTAIAVAEQFGVATSTVGDWINAEAGRTLYLGSKTSRVQVRVYEKGKQLGVDPNWVRLEVQVRPSGDGKSALCRADPEQLMQTARWTAEIARRVGVPELEKVKVRDAWTPSDDDRALAFCVHQYGGVLQRKAAELGGWEDLGRYLRDAVSEAKKTRN